MIRKWLHKIGIHDWNLVKSTGFTSYYQCKICSERTHTQDGGGHQPIDRKWLATGYWMTSDDWGPPPTKSGMA